MNFSEVMDRMLPPSNGQSAVIGGEYGETRGSGTHGGVDFNYPGGQSGINLTNPAVYSPITGVVTGVGGTWGWVTIRDVNGNSHEILHLDSQVVTVGQTIRAGEQIGTMGDTAPYDLPEHVHYQLKGSDNELVNPVTWWATHDVDGNDTSDEGLPDEGDQPLLSDYEKYRALVKKLFTQAEGNIATAYMDDRGGDPKATIGIGFNIEDNDVISSKVFDELGIGYTDEDLIWRAKLTTAFKDSSLTESKSDSDRLMTNLNKMLQDRKDAMSDDDSRKESAKTEFKLTPEEIDKIFWDSLEHYEGIIDKFLYLPERTQNPDGSYPPITNPSNERAALLSLAWLSVIKSDASGSPTLRSDMQVPHRADAWFQIRYDSNKPKSNGVAKRRYMEAQIFGLYADENNVSELEAKQSVDNYLEKYTEILDYETQFQQMIAEADLDLKAAHIKDDGGNLTVDSIGQIFKPIANYIYERYVAEADRTAFEANVGNIDFNIQITGDVVLGHETTGSDGTFIQPVYRWLNNVSPKEGEPLPEGITGINDMLVVSDNTRGFSLQGLYGHDVLIGGEQVDNLYGGYKRAGGGVESGDDILIGGAGDDNLYGQDGRDILRGGDGFDNYYFERGDGTDTIIDQDGNGLIYVKNTETQTEFNILGSASGGVLTHSDPWMYVGSYWEVDSEGRFLTENRYVPYYDAETNSYTLKIIVDEVMLGDANPSANVIWIKNWKNGDFGLTIADLALLENLPPPPVIELPPAPLISSPPRTDRIFDPLAFDLNSDGAIETRPRLNGVYFDLDNSGFAEKTSWVAPADGLLVLDRNNNNFIDGGAELFGTETYLNNGSKAANGFEALAEFDSNHDGMINNSDAIFAELKIWKDENTNGIADAGELLALADANIKSISLTNAVSSFIDNNRVEHREQGSFTRTDDSTSVIHTLWFNRDARQSVAVRDLQGEPIVIPEAILALPNAQGSGNSYSLHEAMVLDTGGTLKAAVESFVQETDAIARKEWVNIILVLWANQQNTAVNSRGEFINAQHLGVLESFWGETAAQQPSAQFSVSAERTYQQLNQSIYSQLMQKTHSKALLDMVDFTYDLGKWHGDFSLVSTALVTNFVNGVPTALAQLQDFVAVVQGYNPYDVNTLYQDFSTAIQLAAAGLPEATRTLVVSAVLIGNDEVEGTSVADVQHGYQGNDDIKGLGGNDQLWGDEGHDQLDGGTGDDSLNGGSGYDVLEGGAGNDTYYFARGYNDDVINELSGVDTIELNGVTESQVYVSRNGADLQLILDTGETLTVVDMFNEGEILTNYAIDKIRFANNVEWDLARINKEVVIGSGENDVLEGFDTSDVIVGHAGDDTLFGAGGNDTYQYQLGDGTDVIVDLAGADKLVLGAGITPDQVLLKRANENLVIVIGASGSITVRGMFTTPGGALVAANALESIEFANNVSWNLADIERAVLSVAGTNTTDFLVGSYGDDTLTGGQGNDVMSASRGNDIYRYGLGDGDDLVEDESGTDTLELGQGIGAQDVNVDHVGNNLVFTFAAGGFVTVANAFADLSNAFLVRTLESVSFHGSAIWDLTKIFNETLKIKGLWGDDTLQGSSEDDVFIGRGGKDLILGGMGDDRYEYNLGDGDDVISDESGVDIVDFGAGITADMIGVHRNGNSLVFTIAGSGTITVNNAFSASENILSPSAIEFVRFSDNSAWDAGRILFEVENTDVPVENTLEGTIGADLLQGSVSNNVLIGGLGNDELQGGGGNDTYSYRFGDGNDVIVDTAGNDVIRLDIGSDGYSLSRDASNNLVLMFSDGGSVVVKNSFELSSGIYGNKVERIEFSNGDVIDVQNYIPVTPGVELRANGTNFIRLIGTANADTLYGGRGHDKLVGGSGNDKLLTGGGNDSMFGGSGDDTYEFNVSGAPIVVDSSGEDVLNFYGVDPEITKLYKNSTDLIVFAGAQSRVTLSDFFDALGNVSEEAIEKIVFSNSTIWDSTYIKDHVLVPESSIVNGTNLDDRIDGGVGNDSISGLEGWDALYGYEGSDTLVGGEGLDNIYGGTGDDTYILRPGDGEDFIYESGGFNIIQLEDYIETDENGDIVYVERIEEADVSLSKEYKTQLRLETNRGNSVLLFDMFDEGTGGLKSDDAIHAIRFANGVEWDYARIQQEILRYTDGNDSIEGFDRDNNLKGGAGSDTLIGFAYNDTLEGGSGSDYLEGQGGNDSYHYALGDGTDHIYESGGIDTLILGAGIDPADVYVSIDAPKAAIVLSLLNGGRITLASMLSAAGTQLNEAGTVESIKFHNGDVWTAEQLLVKALSPGPAVIRGNELNNTLVATSSSELIIGGKGSDTVNGSAGDDVYEFNSTDFSKSSSSSDVITGFDNGFDIIKFTSGITEENIKVKFSVGSVSSPGYFHIILSGSEISGAISVGGMYVDGAVGNGIEQIDFANGNSWSLDRIKTEAIKGTDGDDVIYAYHSNDILAGGKGDDDIVGLSGNDTYIFNLGDGDDNILDIDGNDSLHFGEGILSGDIVVRRTGSFTGEHLELRVNDDDAIKIVRTLDPSGNVNASNVIESIKFESGETWDISRLLTESLKGTNKSDYIVGYYTNDVIHGGKGYDQMSGYEGNDTYQFTIGDEIGIIKELAGDDTVEFLTGISPSDIILGRSGTNLVIHTMFGDEVKVLGMFTGAGALVSSKAIEFIKFSDSTVWDGAKILQQVSLTASSTEIKLGTDNSDTLTGGANSDIIYGESGNDILKGMEGNDTLVSGIGIDTLYGGEGNDLLISGFNLGAGFYVDQIKTLYGGAGSDIYRIQSGSKLTYILNYAYSPIDMNGTGFDVLELPDGVAESNIQVRLIEHSSYRIEIKLNSADYIYIDFEFTLADYLGGIFGVDDSKLAIERIRFFNGPEWNIERLFQEAIKATAADDVIRGFLISELIDGGGEMIHYWVVLAAIP